MPAAVIFDMDGLLFDTEALYQEAILLAAGEGGHEIALDVFYRTVGLPWAQSRTLLLSHFWRRPPGRRLPGSVGAPFLGNRGDPPCIETGRA